MSGVFARVHELTDDLRREYLRCVGEADVSERAKNLFHEVLVKMRSALDMTMWRIWNKYASGFRSAGERAKIEKKVQFPICESTKDYRNKMKEMRLDLEKADPPLDALLLRAQPISTGRTDLLALRDLSNLGKHVRLATQTRTSRPASRGHRKDGAVITVCPPVGSDRDLESRMGGGIDPSSVETVDYVEFSVDDPRVVDPFFYCAALATGLQRYVRDLLRFCDASG